ncbi:MAG: MBL fold metallo-hydrolase [Deltaproteobacteria bacterium]|nr:MBL fold metallo-hydrolase [Deltaproteobacteria bacterium]
MLQHTVQTPYMVGEAHFYSAELESGLALFDTGPPTPQGLARLLESIDLRQLKYLFITHGHVDHNGLANFVAENSSAEIYIARKDAIKFRHHGERMTRMAALLIQYGLGDDFVRRFRESIERHKAFPVVPKRCRIVEESPELDSLGVTWLACPGHTQSDLVYLVGECAVTGDILLRNIFQAPLLDVDLETFEGRFRNYDAYCASLLKLAGLRGRRIMPGHRQYMEGVDKAVLYYVTTLLERAGQLRPFNRLPLNEVIERIFQGRLTDPFFVYLKASEIVFMRDFLENPVLLKDSLERIGLFDALGGLYATVAG